MKSYLTKTKILEYKNVANVTDLNSLTSVIREDWVLFPRMKT